MNEAIRMQVSAFVDGELPSNESELLLRRLSQDAELRQDVAQFLALGRLMRADHGLAGADRLYERVAAELNNEDLPVADIHPAESSGQSRFMQPLVGASIAAAVAMVAIFALQQNTGVDEARNAATAAVETAPVVNEIVPGINVQQERQRQYFRSHAQSASELGANGMNSRVVSLQFSQEVIQPADVETQEDTEASADVDDTEERSTQP